MLLPFIKTRWCSLMDLSVFKPPLILHRQHFLIFVFCFRVFFFWPLPSRLCGMLLAFRKNPPPHPWNIWGLGSGNSWMYHILRLQWCRLTLSSVSIMEFLSWEHSSSRDHCQNNESPRMWKGPIDMMYRVNLDSNSIQFNRGQHAASYQYVREFLRIPHTTVLP